MALIPSISFEARAAYRRLGMLFSALVLGLLPLLAYFLERRPDGSLDSLAIRGLTASAALLGLPLLGCLIGAGALRTRLSPTLLTSPLSRTGLIGSRIIASLAFLLLPVLLLLGSSLVMQQASDNAQLARLIPLKRVHGEAQVGPEGRWFGLMAGLSQHGKALKLDYTPQQGAQGGTWRAAYEERYLPHEPTMLMDPNRPDVLAKLVLADGRSLTLDQIDAQAGRVLIHFPEELDLSEGFTLELERGRMDSWPIIHLYSEQMVAGQRSAFPHTLMLIVAGLAGALMALCLGAMCSTRFTYGSSLIISLAWLTLCYVLPVLAEKARLIQNTLPEALSAGEYRHWLASDSFVFQLFPDFSLLGLRERFEFGQAQRLSDGWRAIWPALAWSVMFLLLAALLIRGRDFSEIDLAEQ